MLSRISPSFVERKAYSTPFIKPKTVASPRFSGGDRDEFYRENDDEDQESDIQPDTQDIEPFSFREAFQAMEPEDLEARKQAARKKKITSAVDEFYGALSDPDGIYPFAEGYGCLSESERRDFTRAVSPPLAVNMPRADLRAKKNKTPYSFEKKIYSDAMALQEENLYDYVKGCGITSEECEVHDQGFLNQVPISYSSKTLNKLAEQSLPGSPENVFFKTAHFRKENDPLSLVRQPSRSRYKAPSTHSSPTSSTPNPFGFFHWSSQND